MKGDRDLVSIERSLGLRSVRGISRQSNKDSPPIKAILDGIKLIATAYVNKSNGEIRASHALQQDALDLLAQHGNDIWPGPEHERPPWLEDASPHAFEGKYPRHLYFTDAEDRQILGDRFYALVVEKCCNYHDNQLQKHRRVSAKNQTGHDDSASVTPRRDDLPWFVDGGQVDGGAESDDVDMGDAPPTNSWSAVNTQQTATAPPPALPSPIETPEVMPHGLPGIYEPKKESSPALPVHNGSGDGDVEMSSPADTRPKSRSQPPREFGNSFSDYYIEDSYNDSDGQTGRKRKRGTVDEIAPNKRSHRDDDETSNGHQSLLVKFKVNGTQLINITNKEPRPASFSGYPRPPSPARTTTSSIADGSAYQGELGRTRGRSKLPSLKGEIQVQVTQYRDKRGKWYEYTGDSRPDWALEEKVITRSVPRGRPPSNYVNRREGSSRASSLARSVTNASDRRSSAAVHNSREEPEPETTAQDEVPQPPTEAEPQTQEKATAPTTPEQAEQAPAERRPVEPQEEAPVEERRPTDESREQESTKEQPQSDVRPTEPPITVQSRYESDARNSTKVTTIRVSWNSAKEVDKWMLYKTTENGEEKDLLLVFLGFERVQRWYEYASFVYVEALDRESNVIGNSGVVKTIVDDAGPHHAPRDGEIMENRRSKKATTPEKKERRRSSVEGPKQNGGPDPNHRSMPPPSVPAQIPSNQTSPERLRVIPLTTLPGPSMLTPRPTHGMTMHDGAHHPNRQPLQPQPPPGFRLHPHPPPPPPPPPHQHARTNSHPHSHPPPQMLPSQHEPSQQAHRMGGPDPPASVLRTLYAHPGPNGPPPPPPRADPPQARYSSADTGLPRKQSLPLGVPLEIRPDVPERQATTNGVHARGPAASEPPPVDQMPRWASVNAHARDQPPPQAIMGARREDKDPTPTATPMRSPAIAHGEVQQLARRPLREAPYAQPPQHAAAASNMQMTWCPDADNILGEFTQCPVGRHLQSVETPRNLLAVYKEILIEEPAARTDFHVFSILSEKRRQDSRYVQEAIRKHVNPSHPGDMSIPPPNPPQHRPEEQRITPHEQRHAPHDQRHAPQDQRNAPPPEHRNAPQPHRLSEPFNPRYAVPNAGPPAPGRDRHETLPPRDAMAGAPMDTSSFNGNVHMNHAAPRPTTLPKPPILPSQAPRQESQAPRQELTDEKMTPVSPGGTSLENVTVEINWGRSLDFTDYMPMKDCSTAKEFFELVEAQLPDELRGEGKKIKEIRVKALTDLAGGSRLPRITRDEGPGRVSLRQLVKKLRSQPPGSEPELEFLVVWEGIPVN